MPQEAIKTYNNFIKGLITEATDINFPANASVNEDNCRLFRKGNRSRRLGIDFETDYALSTASMTSNNIATQVLAEFTWTNAALQNETHFLVLQIATTLYFYDLNSRPISSGIKSFSIDMNTYVKPGADPADVLTCRLAIVSGRGYLFVAGESFNPIRVQYFPETDTIQVKQIYILIRDFDGVDDTLTNSQEPTTLSVSHKYNLFNQGWDNNKGTTSTVSVTQFNARTSFEKITFAKPDETVITDYFNTVKRYPSNSKQWFIGKGTDGVFDANVLNRSYWGATKAPRGHFVLDAFYKDRTAVSGVPGLTVANNSDRPTDVAFFSGRIWYLCKDTVYYSQVLNETADNCGFCYQEADPTSEHVSDLIATDGGVIPIPDLGHGKRLTALNQGMFVFGANGVWFITGNASGFDATNLSVAKITNIGTDAPLSIISIGDKILWMSTLGIMQISNVSGSFGPGSGLFQVQNLSLETIQTFYNTNFSSGLRPFVKAVYDQTNNIVAWLFSSAQTTQHYLYDRVLNLDLTLNAFYTYTVDTSLGCYISGAFQTPLQINEAANNLVIDNAGNQVIDNGNNSVVSGGVSVVYSSVFFQYVLAVATAGVFKLAFGDFTNADFVDWQQFNSVGAAYTSYVDAGIDIVADPIMKKESLYITCYFRQTETQWVLNGADYTLDPPSSCMFRVKWDWATSAASNKWSSLREAYRIVRLPPVDVTNLTLDTGFSIVKTKHKVRGVGRALTFRFQSSEIGKDFDLLGWGVEYKQRAVK